MPLLPFGPNKYSNINFTKNQLPNFFRTSNNFIRNRKQQLMIWLALLLPILLPAAHILIYKVIWPKDEVNKENCTCDCFDNLFKGSYEEGNIAGYKHFYFNTTGPTYKIWVMSILFFIGMYEITKRTIQLNLQGQLRLNLSLFVTASLCLHYQSWWTWFNYWNDDEFIDIDERYGKLQDANWNRQLSFWTAQLPELFTSLIATYYLDRRLKINHLALILLKASMISAIYLAVNDLMCELEASSNKKFGGADSSYIVFVLVPDILRIGSIYNVIITN